MCKQAASVKPTSAGLCWPNPARGRVSGWPQAHHQHPSLELGDLSSISSLATGFLCGPGQIIECKAGSQLAGVWREPWLGR